MSLIQLGPAKNGMLFPWGNTCLPKIRPWANWNNLLYQNSPLLLKTSFRQLTCILYCLASLSTLDTGLCSPFTITLSLSCHNATFSFFPLYLNALCWLYLPFLYLPLNVDFWLRLNIRVPQLLLWDFLFLVFLIFSISRIKNNSNSNSLMPKINLLPRLFWALDLNKVKIHYLWYHAYELTYSLESISNPAVSTCGTFMVIHGHTFRLEVKRSKAQSSYFNSYSVNDFPFCSIFSAMFLTFLWFFVCDFTV